MRRRHRSQPGGGGICYQQEEFPLQICIALKGKSGPLCRLDLLRDISFLTKEMHAGIPRDGEELKRLPTSTTKNSLSLNQ